VLLELLEFLELIDGNVPCFAFHVPGMATSPMGL